MNLFNELKRRNVFRVGIAYLVVAWLVMQVADVVINNIGAPGWLFPSIMLVLGIGFPVVVIFAWAFEMTPEGIKKEKDVDRSQSIAPVTGRKLDRAIIAIMALVIVFLVLDRFVLNDTEEGPEPVAQMLAPVVEEAVAPPQEKGPSIAVLPFVNMSDDSSNEYFSDGLTETLLHMLAQLPELRVAARTSSFAFKGQNASIEEVATTLGVAHILEGSVQKAGNRVRITAQLIRADDGFHVWSHNYDRTLDDIFAIQDEIANDVARALDASLMGTSSVALEGVDTRNTEAYDFYLQSLEQQAIFSFSSLADAENLLKNALAIDPDFADAKLALARNYQMKYETGLIDIESAWASTEPLLLQVKEKRPDDLMAQALTLNAQIQGYLPSVDPEEREAVVSELRNLLPMLPSDTWIRRVVGKYLMTNDRYDDALQVIQAGLLLDPLSAELHMDMGNAYRALDRLDEAQLAYNRALQLAPESPGIYSRMSGLARQKGDLPNSLKWARKAIEKDPQDHELVADLASRMFAIGLLEEGSRWAKRCYALAPQSSPCRRVQLDEARARNQPDQRLALSRAMLEDDIDSRGYGFWVALWTYTNLMIEAGRAEEAFEFLAGLYPDLHQLDQPPTNLNSMLVRGQATLLMRYFKPRDEFLRALDQLTRHEQAARLPYLDAIGYRLSRHLARGEIDQAKAIALNEDLSQNIANSLSNDFRYQAPLYTELVRDPEIAARLRERQDELADLKNKVETMLLDPEWDQ